MASQPEYPTGVPDKFSADGQLQRFPGTTTLCHLPTDSPLLPGLRAIYAALEKHRILSKRMHLLPPASWHMTVFTCIREWECNAGIWPPGDRPKQTLEECTLELIPKIKSVGLALEKQGLAPPYRVRVRNFDPATGGIGLEVEGATPSEDARLRRVRDLLSESLGIRAADHDTYGLHISIAYLLRYIEGDERRQLNELFSEHLKSVKLEFELGPIEFCTFEDMYSYPRLFYLGQEDTA